MVRKVFPVILMALLILIAASTARTAETPPTEDSIRELLEITDSKKMIEASRRNMEGAMEAPIKQLLANQGLSQKQEKILTDMINRSLAILHEELSPEILESIYIEIYRKTLTQYEVDGLIAFYKTDIGRSSVVKMPEIMKQIAEITMQRMQTILPKLQEMQQEMMRRLKEGK
jgi:hypothetical protein